MKSKWDELIKCINEAQKILVFTHANMDGDAMGSSQAFCHAMREIGKECFILLEDKIPKYLNVLHEHDDFYVIEAPWKADLAAAIDCGEESRIAKRLDAFYGAKTRICIDHHIPVREFADHAVIEPAASASGILVYELIKEMGIDIDKHIAEDLYAAISTDTGSFMYNNTDARTHLVAADLYNYGIDHVKICNAIYATFPFAQLKIEARSIENAEVFGNGKAVISYITQEQIKSCGGKYEDADTCIDKLRMIEGVEAACMLKETEEGLFKASLRGKSYANVNEVAVYFGGGGHMLASGCTMGPDLKEAIDSLKKKILEVI